MVKIEWDIVKPATGEFLGHPVVELEESDPFGTLVEALVACGHDDLVVTVSVSR